MNDVTQPPASHRPSLSLVHNAPSAPPTLETAVVEALADAVIVYDAAGRIVDGNPAAETLLGLARPGRKASLAMPIQEREGGVELRTLEGQPLPREEWPAVRVLRGESLTGAQTVDIGARTLDGREVILNVSGAPLFDAEGHVLGAVCVCRDITGRKQLERELVERAAELETIFTTQAEAVVFADTTGRIVRMNEAQRRLLISRGIDPTAEYIDSWSRQAPSRNATGQPITREQLPFYRALRGETITGARAVELYQRARDGRDLVLRVSAAPVCDAHGRILGAVVTTHDVTQQRRLEQQRLDIMRVVTHDLNNPVAAMRLYIQMQQRRLARGEPAFTPNDELLGQMEYTLARVQRLLDDLRVATNVEMGTLRLQRARLDLAALCRQEVTTAQQVATERVIRLKAPAEPVWVDADKERIGQVIANLLTNALKYSPADRPIDVTIRVTGEQATVAVRDKGPGIPPHEQARLFDQFHRVAGIEAQDGSGGLGLGLYISKAMIERHGGQIGVKSTVGAGSTFWFALPLAPASGD